MCKLVELESLLVDRTVIKKVLRFLFDFEIDLMIMRVENGLRFDIENKITVLLNSDRNRDGLKSLCWFEAWFKMVAKLFLINS